MKVLFPTLILLVLASCADKNSESELGISHLEKAEIQSDSDVEKSHILLRCQNSFEERLEIAERPFCLKGGLPCITIKRGQVIISTLDQNDVSVYIGNDRFSLREVDALRRKLDFNLVTKKIDHHRLPIVSTDLQCILMDDTLKYISNDQIRMRNELFTELLATVPPKRVTRERVQDFDPQIVNCTEDQADQYRYAVNGAMSRGTDLLEEINDRLYLGSADYRRSTVRKIRGAQRMVECALRKIPKLRYKCKEKHPFANAGAWTFPIIGRTIVFYDNMWGGASYYRISTVMHEATHKCASNDARYYYQSHLNINKYAKRMWHWTASTYDWWMIRGFCVPGDDC